MDETGVKEGNAPGLDPGGADNTEGGVCTIFRDVISHGAQSARDNFPITILTLCTAMSRKRNRNWEGGTKKWDALPWKAIEPPLEVRSRPATQAKNTAQRCLTTRVR